MKMFGHPKHNFFTQKASLNMELYGQREKITPEPDKNRLPFSTESQWPKKFRKNF